MKKQQLIQILHEEINNEVQHTVNARDLHSYLSVRRDFSNWIKGRIKSFGFQINIDFTLLAKKGEQVSGAKYKKEYHVTLDMAKELAMVERTEKGREARRYFIQKEKELIALKTKKEIRALPAPEKPDWIGVCRLFGQALNGVESAKVTLHHLGFKTSGQIPPIYREIPNPGALAKLCALIEKGCAYATNVFRQFALPLPQN